ncbi:hypothetical protein GCM10027456_36270 [Kineosporia babensis]
MQHVRRRRTRQQQVGRLCEVQPGRLGEHVRGRHGDPGGVPTAHLAGDDLVADLETGACPHRVHHAGDFEPDHLRQHRGVLARPGRESLGVGRVHPRRPHRDPDLTGTGLRDRERLQFQYLRPSKSGGDPATIHDTSFLDP